MLKGGIVYASAVTTVSPTYKDETLLKGAAGWLSGTLQRPNVAKKYHGILNGIDAPAWDPAADQALPAPYTPDLLDGKALCKRYVQEGLGLAIDPAAPLLICVTRLVPQKGIHLIAAAMRRTAERGGQFVLLGTGHADGVFRDMMANDFRDSDRVRILLTYSDRLSRQLFAGSDLTVVPSMFEPCGLTQMNAMRYGSVPLVRKTGGLADTVFDVEADPAGGNGFVFEGVDEASCVACVDRALAAYRRAGEGREVAPGLPTWADLQRRNMAVDVSWGPSARLYSGLYEKLLFGD